ncbi:MAG TPA: hypothetical protein VGR81_00225 [Candidatus Acidoferrales bacterium]|nr:hypothetical protein [Candidatus Acidoferrales bacterium]
MRISRELRNTISALILALVNAAFCVSAPARQTMDSKQQQEAPAPTASNSKKLVMKDGTVQKVSGYQIEGDRVRYFSVDRSEWEEIPAAMVDWDATKKADAAEASQENALTAKISADEVAKTIPMDVDASLEVLPGVLLPSGDGLFALDGQTIVSLKETEATSKLDKGKLLERVLIPVPVVPTRRTILLKGTRADIRVKSFTPEFYFRTKEPGEPEVQLFHAQVKDGMRRVESIDTLFDNQQQKAKTVSMQEWKVANGVYRFTLSQPLVPGEYAVTEISPDEGVSMLLWDFGIDAPPRKKSKKKK